MKNSLLLNDPTWHWKLLSMIGLIRLLFHLQQLWQAVPFWLCTSLLHAYFQSGVATRNDYANTDSSFYKCLQQAVVLFWPCVLAIHKPSEWYDHHPRLRQEALIAYYTVVCMQRHHRNKLFRRSLHESVKLSCITLTIGQPAANQLIGENLTVKGSPNSDKNLLPRGILCISIAGS